MRKDEPIIKSFFDIDFYKFTMAQMIFARPKLRDLLVTFAFKNRTNNIHLGNIIDIGQLREELDHAKSLVPNRRGLYFIRFTNKINDRMFTDQFCDFLKNDFKMVDYHLDTTSDGQLDIRTKGPWVNNTIWETMVMDIVQELYVRALMKDMSRFERLSVEAEGIIRLKQALDIFKRQPDITWSDFGTRRRRSFEWQKTVNEIAIEEAPNQFLGTSNVQIAMELGLEPKGTNAHELAMVLAGLAAKNNGSAGAIKASQWELLGFWWDQFGEPLSLNLTDTFGSKWFFENAPEYIAQDWRGSRQDSGDPYTWTDAFRCFHNKWGVSPTNKLAVYSDGLTVEAIASIAAYCRGKNRFTFGWGTNFTNNLGLPQLSIVMKAVEVEGQPLVKLSDNIAKAIGPEDEINRYKEIFSYEENFNEGCKV